jgi:hypothetical protein
VGRFEGWRSAQRFLFYLGWFDCLDCRQVEVAILRPLPTTGGPSALGIETFILTITSTLDHGPQLSSPLHAAGAAALEREQRSRDRITTTV